MHFLHFISWFFRFSSLPPLQVSLFRCQQQHVPAEGAQGAILRLPAAPAALCYAGLLPGPRLGGRRALRWVSLRIPRASSWESKPRILPPGCLALPARRRQAWWPLRAASWFMELYWAAGLSHRHKQGFYCFPLPSQGGFFWRLVQHRVAKYDVGFCAVQRILWVYICV